MTSRMNENLMKALFFVVMFMVLLFQSFFSSAHSQRKDHRAHADEENMKTSRAQTPFVRW